MTPRISTNRGFSLIEVIVSLGILSIVVLIFAFSIPLAKRTGNMNGQYAQAISLCQHKIDQLRSQGQGKLNYENLAPAEIIDADKTVLPYKFTVIDTVDEFLPEAATAIQIEPYASYTNVDKVTVTVTWNPYPTKDKTCTVSLSALVTNVE